MTKAIGVMGCGWLGMPLARRLVEKGNIVRGSSTSKEKLRALEQLGIDPYLIVLKDDDIAGDIEAFLKDLDVLVINVPPGVKRNSSSNYEGKMGQIHQRLGKGSRQKILFISSISVYGDEEGELNEATMPEPTTESGRQLLMAEDLFRNDKNIISTIVRFGGLIGDGRHPVNTLSGRTSLSNGDEAINLIHLNDCIKVLENIIEKEWWGEVFNGVYPYHPTKREYYQTTANQIGLPEPHYEENKGQRRGKIVKSANLKSKGFEFDTPVG